MRVTYAKGKGKEHTVELFRLGLSLVIQDGNTMHRLILSPLQWDCVVRSARDAIKAAELWKEETEHE